MDIWRRAELRECQTSQQFTSRKAIKKLGKQGATMRGCQRSAVLKSRPSDLSPIQSIPYVALLHTSGRSREQ